jgi:RNase P subunit RPR2
MIRYETRQVVQEQMKEFICDKCKRVLTTSPEDSMELQEAYMIEIHGGYESVFGDMSHVTCDLCQDCLKELIGSFCVYQED